MTRMDRLSSILDDADQLLTQADDQTIDEALARGEAPDHHNIDDSCPWCGHSFHGLPCAPRPSYAPARGEDYFSEIDTWSEHLTGPDPTWCGCDTALARPDDTWRPVIFDSAQEDWLRVMDESGVDGWAARIEVLHRQRAAYERALQAPTHGRHRHGRQAAGAAFGALRVASGSFFIAPANTPPPTDSIHLSLTDRERDLTELPQDPRARALHHQRTRGTGPEHPTAGRAHRPRHHQ